MSRRKKSKKKKVNTYTQETATADAKPKQRSAVFGILAVVIACVNIITILTTYRGIVILLPAPFILGIISMVLSRHDKNETGFVYGVVSILFYTMLMTSLFIMYVLTKLANH